MAAEFENGSGEALVHLEREVANIKNALGLLGVKPCSVCGKFYLASNPGNLFTACGDAVCYDCFSGWWLNCCPHLSVSDRESIEYKLMRWLLDYHRATVYREFSKLPPKELQDVCVVVACHECNGSGKMGGERCRHCLGNRTVWVVSLK